jgi:NADH dehydrogenase FAD-containing subunit
VKILHIVKKAPDVSTKKIIDIHAATNQVTTVELYKGGVSYDKLVSDIFAHEKVFCW